LCPAETATGRLTIGFELTDHEVAENAGNISLCVRILQPSDTVSLGDDTFRVGIRTNQNLDSNGG
jgi:hypothetical protein